MGTVSLSLTYVCGAYFWSTELPKICHLSHLPVLAYKIPRPPPLPPPPPNCRATNWPASPSAYPPTDD